MTHRLLLLLAVLGGCDDGLDQRLAIVEAPRVLAVIGEPAEARPGSEVRYRAIVGGPDGPVAALPRWAYCTAPKPPTEDNSVSAACLTDALVDLGEAAELVAPLPADGCRTFGPDTPPGEFRPRDPDPSGGFYQPLRLDVADGVAFALARLRCNLGNAPVDIAREFQLRYTSNTNPQLDPIALAPVVAAGTAVELRASWPAGTAEPYVSFDQLAQALVDRREALRVSWYATAGAIAVDASAIDEGSDATDAATTWTTPTTPGRVWLWFVLRDSRGGSAAQAIAVDVE